MAHRMKPWDYGRLQVSANRRYLQNGEQPFFWLGDTAWLMLPKLSLEETYLYLKNRSDKGFNVIQMDFVHKMPVTNINGETAFINDDLSMPNLEGGYWNHVDQVIAMAEDLGLYMAILPVWGSSIVKGGHLNLTNVDAYINFITERYANRPNIIWVIGGDVRVDVNLELFNKMGELIKKKNPEYLVTYHPFGRTSSSQWLSDKSWLDFNMFQSGHRRYDQSSLGEWDDNAVKEEFYGEDNWKYVVRDYSLSPNHPTIDAEPSYELIPHGLHDATQPYWQDYDVRRYAYWSVFAGSMGHTYGDNSVMQFYKDREKKPAYGAKDLWHDAIHHIGSSHMTHLKALMESVDFINGHIADELLLSGQKKEYDRIAVFASVNYILCYSYSGSEFKLDLSSCQGKKLSAYWYDPTSGIYSYWGDVTGKTEITAKPPVRPATANDWVLVIR